MDIKNFSGEIQNGNMKLTVVVATPRTMSTIFERMLAQGVDGQVHEPFRHPHDNNFGFGLIDIHKHGQNILKEKGEPPVHLVVKIMADSLSRKELEAFLPLAENIVLLTRNPENQVLSYIKQVYSDRNLDPSPQKLVSTLENLMSTDSTQRYMQGTAQYTVGADMGRAYGALEHCVIPIVTKLSSQEKIHVCTVNMSSLAEHPHAGMQQLCTNLKGIPYHPDMVDNLSKTQGNQFYCPNTDNWIGPARNAMQFTPRQEENIHKKHKLGPKTKQFINTAKDINQQLHSLATPSQNVDTDSIAIEGKSRSQNRNSLDR